MNPANPQKTTTMTDEQRKLIRDIKTDITDLILKTNVIDKKEYLKLLTRVKGKIEELEVSKSAPKT